MAAPTTRERAAEQRRKKLEHVEEQLKAGSLTIRPMTPEERARWARSPERRQSAR